MFRHVALTVLATLCTVVPASADIGADAAQQIARQFAIQHDPALANPATKVAKNETDQAVALDVSDPYRLNGELFYRTYTTYEYTKINVAQYSGIGTKVHSTAASAPLPGALPADLKPRALSWVAYWHPQGTVSSDVTIGAHKTKVYLFRFYLGFLGPSCFVGVDADGKTFDLELGNQLTPWGHDTNGRLRYLKFLALEAVTK